jgi:hypothetical protein
VATALASSETIVSYHVTTEDVFPSLGDIDASVTLDCSAVFNCSDGTVLPSNSMNYSITGQPGSGALTVNYKVDRPLLKRSGSPSVSINPTWLLGDSPPVTVYNDGIVKITVIFHGRIDGQVSAAGNGSATPSSITWSTWGRTDIIVSANASALNGQVIQIQTATKYVAYFTVTVELVGIESLTRDSQTKEVWGSPIVQNNVLVVPEFPAWQLILFMFLILSIVITTSQRKQKRRKHKNTETEPI